MEQGLEMQADITSRKPQAGDRVLGCISSARGLVGWRQCSLCSPPLGRAVDGGGTRFAHLGETRHRASQERKCGQILSKSDSDHFGI